MSYLQNVGLFIIKTLYFYVIHTYACRGGDSIHAALYCNLKWIFLHSKIGTISNEA